MRLPMVSAAKVPRAKIVLYLLNPEHRVGKAKARFFGGHEFTPERWQTLAEAILQHARENEVSKQEATPLGTRWVVEGPMRVPGGTVAKVRAVWFIEAGERKPRFVTAYPLKRSQQV